jgi:hypothetical protein
MRDGGGYKERRDHEQAKECDVIEERERERERANWARPRDVSVALDAIQRASIHFQHC